MATKRRKPSKRRGSAEAFSASDFRDELTRLFGEKISLKTLSALPPVVERVPTGVLALDRHIDGGLPVGRSIEIAAWEGVGKSTLLDQIIASWQRHGGIAHLCDTEESRAEAYTRSLGVDTSSLIVPENTNTLEGLAEYIGRVCAAQEALKKKKRPLPKQLIALDSLGGTPSKDEFDSDERFAGGITVGPRVFKQALRRLTQRISHLNITFIFNNHFYPSIGPGPTRLISYGGSGVRYFTSLRIWLTRTGGLKIGNVDVGHTVEIKLKKSRVSRPRPPAIMGLLYGGGFDNAYTLYEWGLNAPNPDGVAWVLKHGAYSYFYPPGEDGVVLHRRWFGLGELFVERPDLYQMMIDQYLEEGREEVEDDS